MKVIAEFVKVTLAGGVLFLVPVVLTVILVREALKLAGKVLAPVARLVPAETVAGIVVADLLAVAAVLALCFAAGLFIRTQTGHTFGDRLERVVLRHMPGFTIFKSLTSGMVGLGSGSNVAVALARIEDAWGLCFVLERHETGVFTVFVPSAPIPAAGSIYYPTEDRLQLLNVPVAEAVACIMRLGVGSRELLDSQRQLVEERRRNDFQRDESSTGSGQAMREVRTTRRLAYLRRLAVIPNVAVVVLALGTGSRLSPQVAPPRKERAAGNGPG